MAKLYGELAADDRYHLELHFREHRSLHDYIPKDPTGTADKFIHHINSGSPQGGLVSWRYILLDGLEQVPQTSLWTMSEIWDAICCRIRTASGQHDCFRLRERLAAKFRSIATGRIVPYDGFIDELNSWIALNGGDQVAVWVDLLVKTSRDTTQELQVPDRFRHELANMAREAIADLSKESADPDETYLLRRLQHPEQTLGLGLRLRVFY